MSESPTRQSAREHTADAAPQSPGLPATPAGRIDLGLLILRLGIGAAVLQAGLIKAGDFTMTTQFMADAGWRAPTFAALMVTATETLSGLALLLGVLTPLAGCAALGAMLCAWAVNVSGTAFWAEPFNVPFLLGLGAATLIFTGAGRYSIDGRLLHRVTWSMRSSVLLVGLALVVAAATWLALYGVNPIHFTTPPAP